jgi:hypothetical protein
MSITLPVWLFVSQWVLLFALGAFIVLVYRQIGYMMHLKSANTEEQEGLSIGETAPAFDYIFANRSETTSSRFEPKGKWSLLLFADPGCTSCQRVLPSLEYLVAKMRQPLHTLVITGANPVQIEVSDTFRMTSLVVGHVNYDVMSKMYRTHVTPFAYIIDTQGNIQAKGVVAEEAALRKILFGVNRSVITLESLTS